MLRDAGGAYYENRVLLSIEVPDHEHAELIYGYFADLFRRKLEPSEESRAKLPRNPFREAHFGRTVVWHPLIRLRPAWLLEAPPQLACSIPATWAASDWLVANRYICIDVH